MVNGTGQISAAIRLRKEIEGEWLLGLSGVFSLLLGIAILIVSLGFNLLGDGLRDVLDPKSGGH